MANWDETKPAGTDSINQGDDQIRSDKVAIRERVDLEHTFNVADTDPSMGKHKKDSARINYGTLASLPGSADEGRCYFATDTQQLFIYTSIGWKEIMKLNAGNLDVANNKIVNLANPSAGTDAVNKTTLDGAISTLDASLSADIAAITPYDVNLCLISTSTNPTSQIDISANTVWVENIKRVNFGKTIDITISGDGGLDTGVEASSTWYYIWMIAKTDGTTSAILSASATSPTLPAGYTKKRLIGCVYNDASSNFYKFSQSGKFVQYRDVMYEPFASVGFAQDPAWTTIVVSSYVPPPSVLKTKIRLGYRYTYTNVTCSTGKIGYIASKNTYDYGQVWITFSTSPTTVESIIPLDLIMETNTAFYCQRTAGGTINATMYLYCLGFELLN